MSAFSRWGQPPHHWWLPMEAVTCCSHHEYPFQDCLYTNLENNSQCVLVGFMLSIVSLQRGCGLAWSHTSCVPVRAPSSAYKIYMAWTERHCNLYEGCGGIDDCCRPVCRFLYVQIYSKLKLAYRFQIQTHSVHRTKTILRDSIVIVLMFRDELQVNKVGILKKNSFYHMPKK